MPSAERGWKDVKHLGGCPVCGHKDWCTFRPAKEEGFYIVTCMREPATDEFEVVGKSEKVNKAGQPYLNYKVPMSALTGGNGSSPSVSASPSVSPASLQPEKGKVFLFRDKRGRPTHLEIHKAAIYHWNGAGWSPGMGDRQKPLYRLPQVLEAIQNGEDIWITEGYKDADTLVEMGLCATSGGSAQTWLPEYTASLRGAKRVILCGDMDDAGQKRLEKLKQTLALAVEEIWEIPAFPGFKDRTGADVTDYIEAGHTLEDLLALMEPVEQDILPVYSTEELLQMDFHTDWIIKNVLSPKGLVMVLGAPAAGKSMLMLDLAFSLAHKDRWLGLLPIEWNCNVLLISGEGGAEVLGERVEARPREEWNATGKEVYFWTEDKDPDGGLSLSHEKVARIVKAIRRHKIEVVIFDPLVEFHTGDENSQKEMAEIVKVLREIIHATNACVIFTHHTRKGKERDTTPGDMMEGRGSTVLQGAAETILSLKHVRDERHLFFSKIRRGRKPEDVALVFGDDLVFRYKRDLNDAEKRPARQGANQKVFHDDLLDWLEERGKEGKWLTAREIAKDYYKNKVRSETVKEHLDLLYSRKELERRERKGRGNPHEYINLTFSLTSSSRGFPLKGNPHREEDYS